ncbi:MAG: tellurite resistance TerB family protein [Micropepsaceae bacterium]
MSFLKRTFGGGASLSPREEMKEAIAYFVVLMIYADGSVEDSEIAAARSTLARCHLFNDNSADEDFDLLRRMESKMQADAEGAAEHYAGILGSGEWKYTAAAIMCDIMLADGDVGDDELHLLTHLASTVGIDTAELEAMTATISALRRSWQS